MDIDRVRSAVLALYRSTTEAERSAANQWLMAFAGTTEAWSAAHALVQSENEVGSPTQLPARSSAARVSAH